MKRYENLEEALCRELEKLDKKYGGGTTTEMSEQDVERADILYHALKSAATYHAMKDAEERGGWDGRDGREDKDAYGSGRSYRTGRDGMWRYDGSGHYPMYPQRYRDGYESGDRWY